MFRTPEARTALRAGLAAVMAGLSALGAALVDDAISSGEIVAIATAFVGAVVTWYGVGAASPTEPFLNPSSGERVEVPAEHVKPV